MRGFVASVATLLLLVASSGARLRQCQNISWRSEYGSNFLESTEGRVTLVALLTASCSYCVEQAGRLQALQNRLATEGIDVAIVIVNAGDRRSRNHISNFENAVSFPIVQDNNDRDIWTRAFSRGRKDDFYLFDRCGRLTYKLPSPLSYLGYRYTERFLRRTHSSNFCGCNNRQDVMQGDQPYMNSVRGQLSISRARGVDRSPCLEGDQWCRRLLRRLSSQARGWNHHRRRGMFGRRGSRRRGGHNGINTGSLRLAGAVSSMTDPGAV